MFTYVKTFDFQTGSFLLDDVLVGFPLKNSYLYSTLSNLSAFLLVMSLMIFMVNNSSFFLYLISMEMILLASMMNFLSYLYFLDWMESEMYIYYMLTVAVGESAFGLGLLIHSFNLKKSISPLLFNDLN